MAGEKKSRRTEEAKSAGKPAARPAARHRSSGPLHMDSEQAARFMLIGGIAAIILIALGFVAFGWYWTEKRPQGRTVLQVEEYKVSFSSMKRRMAYELFQTTALQQNAGALPSFAYDNLLEELTVLSRADEAGAIVDQVKIDEGLRTRIGVTAETDQRTFQDRLRSQLDATGLNETEFRRLVQGDTTRTVLQDKFKTEIPATILQAKIETINAESEEKALAAIDRINAGEAFADVAKELSIDPNKDTDGGLSDYEAKGGFPAGYNDYAFSAEIGALSGPLNVAGNANFYVVRVVDRSDQPVRDDQKPTLGQDKYDEWLKTTQQEMENSGATKNKFQQDDQQEALTDVVNNATPRIVAQYTAQAEAQASQQTAVAEATLNPAPTAVPVTPGAETPVDGATPAADTPIADPTEGTSTDITPPSQPVAPSTP